MKDFDSQKIALYLKVLPYAVVVAGVSFAAALTNGVSILNATAIFVCVFLVAMLLPMLFVDRAAEGVATIYMSGGASTPAPAQYSLAESLVARDRFDEAIEAYTLLSEDFPQDPEPRIRLARVLRDKKRDYEGAAEWFKRALNGTTIEAAVEVAVIREVVEIYTHKLQTPERALALLSRLSEKHSGHPASVWARNEYLEIKNEMNAKRSS